MEDKPQANSFHYRHIRWIRLPSCSTDAVWRNHAGLKTNSGTWCWIESLGLNPYQLGRWLAGKNFLSVGSPKYPPSGNWHRCGKPLVSLQENDLLNYVSFFQVYVSSQEKSFVFSLAHGLSVCNYMYLSQTHIPPYAHMLVIGCLEFRAILGHPFFWIHHSIFLAFWL